MKRSAQFFLKIRVLLLSEQTCTKIKNQTIFDGELKKVILNQQKLRYLDKILTVDNILDHQTCGRWHVGRLPVFLLWTFHHSTFLGYDS